MKLSPTITWNMNNEPSVFVIPGEENRKQMLIGVALHSIKLGEYKIPGIK